MRYDDYAIPDPYVNPTITNVPPLRGPESSEDCAQCPFANRHGVPERPVPGEGPDDPKWLIVAESPGTNEVYWRRPLVGATGKLVDKMLACIKQPRSEIYLTNSMLCQPPPNATEDEKRRARQSCFPRLLIELAQFPGKPIFALGAHAGQALLGDDFSVMKKIGSYNVVDVDGLGPRAVIPSIHPAAILRGGAGVAGAHAPDLAFWGLIYDANKVKMLAEGRDPIIKEERGVDFDYESEDPIRAEQLIEQVAKLAYDVKLVAVDTETYVDDKRHHALQPLHAKLRAISLATSDFGVSVIWDTLPVRGREIIRDLLADPAIRKLAHNRLYDAHILERYGMPVSEPFDDTLLLHHCAFPGMAHDLQRVTTQFYCVTPWKAEFRGGKDIPDNLVLYSAKDALCTAKLFAPLTIAVKQNDAERAYQSDIEMAKVAALMHRVGVPVSREVNQQYRKQFGAAMKAARDVIENRATEPGVREELWRRLAFEQAKRPRKKDSEDFDQRMEERLGEIRKKYDKGKWIWRIGSSDHLVAYLRARGVGLYVKTDTGRTSTRKDILEALAHMPEVRAILDYRTNQKMYSTFCASLYDQYKPDGSILRYGYADENGRIHPRWSVNKITGRWGAEDPMCFDGETELLTFEGWQRFDRLDRSLHVAQYNINSGEVSFVHPTQYIEKDHDGTLTRLEGRDVDLLVTHDHRIPIRAQGFKGFKEWFDVRADAFPLDGHLMLALQPSTEATAVWREINVCRRLLVDTASIMSRSVAFNGKVYCVSVPSSYVVVRRNGHVMVAGNCQNIPKADRRIGRPNLRAQMVAPKGRKFVGFDFKALEARLIALLSGDPFLVDVFANGKDIHTEFARVVWPQFDTFDKEQRKKLRDQVKRPEYGAYYGGQIETLWKNLVRDNPAIKLEDIARMVRVMTEKTPGVGRWHEELLRNVARPPHEIRSFLHGRRRCFPLGNADTNDVYNFGVQCLREDQHVQLTSGWRKISALIPGTDVLQQPSGKTTTNFKLRATGRRQTYEIRTQGRRIFATCAHRFLAYIRGGKVAWMTVKRLRPGMFVAVANQCAEGGQDPAEITPEIAEVVGALLGNGCCSGPRRRPKSRLRDGFVITCTSKKHARRLFSFLQRAWPDLKCAVRPIKKDEKWHVQLWSVAAESALATARLLRIGIKPAVAKDKAVPEWALTASFAVRCGLLRGLFDTDGGFSSNDVVFTSTSERLAEDVQRLLWSVGVDSRLHRLRGAVFRVVLRPVSVGAFRRCVDFTNTVKRQRLRTRKRSNPINALPPELVTHLAELLIKRLPRSGKSWSALDHARLAQARRGSASRQQLQKIFAAARPHVKVDDLEAMLVFDFERVCSITPSGRAATFDLEILDNDHGYVAEGLITHNSSGADLMNTGLARIMPHLTWYKDCWPIMQIHDAVVFECYEDDAEKVAADVKECFTQEYTNPKKGVTVQFPIDLKIGDSWDQV